MPIRLRQNVSVSVSSGTQEKKDLGNTEWETLTDALGEGGTWKTLVAAGATDVQINLDNIAVVNFLAIRTAAKDPTMAPVALSFKKETTGGEVFVVAPLASTKEGHFMITTDSITALYVTNAGSADMEVVIVAAGD